MLKRLQGALLVFLLTGAGCGALIPPDLDDQPLSFPEREFRLDADELGLTDSAAVMPTIACGQCSAELDSFCSSDNCIALCDSATSACRADVLVALSQTYDLREDGQGFAALDGLGAQIVIDDVTFDVVTNTLNVPTPEIALYLAPITVVDIADSRAKLVGTVSPVSPGDRGRRSISFATDGRAHLQDVLEDYLTPFNLLVVARVSVRAGEVLPAGMLVGKVRVLAHADLGG
jgi:hypothetical protein